MGVTGYNYKLGVCANTTSGNTKVCNKTNLTGVFNIGLPRYGEMFSSQLTSSNDAVNMWLINRQNSTSAFAVWNIINMGIAFNNSSTGTRGARPTLHLKSTVKIISGSGTPNDPYVVGI